MHKIVLKIRKKFKQLQKVIKKSGTHLKNSEIKKDSKNFKTPKDFTRSPKFVLPVPKNFSRPHKNILWTKIFPHTPKNEHAHSLDGWCVT